MMNAINTESTESVTCDEAVAIVATLHSDTLGLEAEAITSERAEKVVNTNGIQTTTEVLLLLARFHADVEDSAGAALLAAFAVQFATLEATVV